LVDSNIRYIPTEWDGDIGFPLNRAMMWK